MTGTLYVVATPLGNLKDISERARTVLADVALIACEDTRHTRKLLASISVNTPTTSYHEHNEEAKAPLLVEKLSQGIDIALVSDAGTPLLSDPGFYLVRQCRQAEIEVVPIPGPFAGVAAACVSGLPTDQILFAGFLGKKTSVVRKRLQTLASIEATVVLYLSPHRLQRVLSEVRESFGSRQAFLIREMTKLHETAYWGSLDSIIASVASEKPIGEYTLVIAGSGQKRNLDSLGELDVPAYVAGLMQARNLSRKHAMQAASLHLGIPRRSVYQRMLDDKK